MARKKLSEYKTKSILSKELGIPFTSYSYDASMGSFSDHQKSLDSSKQYIVKVDQGIKKRFKQGLIKLNLSIDQLSSSISELQQKGYSKFIIEEFISYDKTEEKYLSLLRTRAGIEAYYSEKGGVDIEENRESVKKFVFPYPGNNSKDEVLGFAHMQDILDLEWKMIKPILSVFERDYFSFLELNPFIIHNSKLIILDAAAEVDSTAEFFVNGVWSEKDFVEVTKQNLPEVESVKQLAAKSTAAFSLTVLNPNGAIGMLLSSGGASIILADEVGNLRYGKELLNYGEYSGGPNTEETYIYAKNIISLLLRSSAPKKVLIIAGGVANFTDIRITFRGVINALEEAKSELQKQNIKVFVRRGGPSQKKGLQMIKDFLQKENLFGEVSGPEMVLTDIVVKAVGYLKS